MLFWSGVVVKRVINGLNINYFEKGEGELCVLLHGWGSNISLFESMADNVLSKKFKVVAMDLPGFGGSDEPQTPWKVDDYADFVLDFLKEYNPQKVIFVCHSFGCRILLKLMAKQSLPFEVQKIVITGGAGILHKKTFKQNFKIKMYKLSKCILNFKLVKMLFPSALDNLKNKKGSADYKNASPVMKTALVMAVNEDLTHLIDNIKCPVWLAWGKNDTATPVGDAYLMNQKMPNSYVTVFENSGHYAYLDEMFDFNRELKKFFEI